MRASKQHLQACIDRRPSGTRQKIAGALGKPKSFVSQITNPAYPSPVPPHHDHDFRDLPLLGRGAVGVHGDPRLLRELEETIRQIASRTFALVTRHG